MFCSNKSQLKLHKNAHVEFSTHFLIPKIIVFNSLSVTSHQCALCAHHNLSKA